METAYSNDDFKDVIKAAKGGTTPIELLIKNKEEYRTMQDRLPRRPALPAPGAPDSHARRGWTTSWRPANSHGAHFGRVNRRLMMQTLAAGAAAGGLECGLSGEAVAADAPPLDPNDWAGPCRRREGGNEVGLGAI